ncbi:hypothetical protein CP01DC11_1094, partial [Chlamydia psittaci 01DC11]
YKVPTKSFFKFINKIKATPKDAAIFDINAIYMRSLFLAKYKLLLFFKFILLSISKSMFSKIIF